MTPIFYLANPLLFFALLYCFCFLGLNVKLFHPNGSIQAPPLSSRVTQGLQCPSERQGTPDGVLTSGHQVALVLPPGPAGVSLGHRNSSHFHMGRAGQVN